MEDNKILTFSVAAYNVEKTLGETLQSLITDGDVMGRMEVIIVNDGSRDNTAEIAQGYVDKYPGTFRLVNKENGGHGSTLNASLEIASGKYYKMLDGDDWVETANLRELIDFLEQSEADLVFTPYIKVYPNHEETVVRHGMSRPDTRTADLTVEQLKDVFAHELAVRTAVLRENRVRMTEHCFYVDMELVFFSLLYAKTTAGLDIPVYRYRLGVAGQSASIQGRIKHWEDAIRVEKHLLETYLDHEGSLASPAKEVLYEMVIRFAIYQYQNFVLMKDDKKARSRARAFDTYLKAYAGIYRETGRSRLVKLLRGLGFRFMEFLYSYVSRVAL